MRLAEWNTKLFEHSRTTALVRLEEMVCRTIEHQSAKRPQHQFAESRFGRLICRCRDRTVAKFDGDGGLGSVSSLHSESEIEFAIDRQV